MISKTWETAEGEEIAYADLTDRHLCNIISFLERKFLKEGKSLYMGGSCCYGLSSAEDMEAAAASAYTLEGKEALEEMGYYDLIEEAKKRGL